MQPIEQLDNDAIGLLSDALPTTTVNLLPEWEATLGLPDPCLGPNPTLQQQRDQILARLVGSGGQSAQYFRDFATALGFEIEIETFAPFRTGRSRVGQPLGGADWMFVWRVNIISDATSADHAAFRVGESRMGDPLNSAAAAHATLQCEMQKLAPAHTVLLFSF